MEKGREDEMETGLRAPKIMGLFLGIPVMRTDILRTVLGSPYSRKLADVPSFVSMHPPLSGVDLNIYFNVYYPQFLHHPYKAII